MDIIRNWCINIIAVMLLSAFAEILMPDGSFKKYCKLVLGLIVMIVIITPIIKLTNSDLLMSRFALQTSDYIDKTAIEKQNGSIKAVQNDQIVRTYKSKLITQIDDRLKVLNLNCDFKTDVEIDSDLKSSGFGSIRSVDIRFIKLSDKNLVQDVNSVSLGNSSNKTNTTNKKDTENQEKIKQKIINEIKTVYNIAPENIKVQEQKNEGG